MRKGPNDEPLQGGWEYDALTRAKRVHRFGPGVRNAIKSGFWRRLRRVWRERLARRLRRDGLYE